VFKVPEPEPLHLTRTFAPDGSYPPRLLSKGVSWWLNPTEKNLENSEFYYEFVDDTWYLVQTGSEFEFRINNTLIKGRHRLADGDFIRINDCRYDFFQLDPAADYKAWSSSLPQQCSLVISPKVKKYLLATNDFISLDGGQHFANWEKVMQVTLFASSYGRTKGGPKSYYRFSITYQGDSNHFDFLPSQLQDLNQDEATVVLQWITMKAPIHLSFGDGKYALLDAFSVMAYKRFIQSGAEIPDTTIDVKTLFTQIPGKWHEWKKTIAIILSASLAFGFLAWITDNGFLVPLLGALVFFSFIHFIMLYDLIPPNELVKNLYLPEDFEL
jgi:hypothetical protein